MNRTLDRRDWIVAGVVAGIAAGITVSAFAAFNDLQTGDSPLATYAFVATVFAGPQAQGAPWAVPLGILAVFGASIGWAFGYLTAARRQRQLLRRPLLSGIGFGIIVWFVNLLVLVAANRFAPTFFGLDRDLIAYIAFFGMPLAFVASRLLRDP
jgi:hypothetical protein